jgi:phosphatidylglycerol:prolipoprotein diacylglycerol transferase
MASKQVAQGAPQEAGPWSSLRRLGARRPNLALQISTFGWEQFADAEPQALGLTYWFDTEAAGEPYPVSNRFTGRRIGVNGRPRGRDSFSVVESLDRVVPGSGPVAITTRVLDVAPGEWHVTATSVSENRRDGPLLASASKRRARLPSASSSGVTAYAPIIRIRAPGVRVGAWPALVGVGVAFALGLQALLARQMDLPAARVLLVSLVASVTGLVGAKLYFLAELRGRLRNAVTSGMCIQGFVLGAIGALTIGVVALLVVWTRTPGPAGSVFVAVIAAYTIGRQILFPLRDLGRHTAHGRKLTIALAAMVMAGSITVAAVN